MGNQPGVLIDGEFDLTDLTIREKLLRNRVKSNYPTFEKNEINFPKENPKENLEIIVECPEVKNNEVENTENIIEVKTSFPDFHSENLKSPNYVSLGDNPKNGNSISDDYELGSFGIDVTSSNFIPQEFEGIRTNTIGNSQNYTNPDKNPFLDIKNIAMDSTKSLKSRQEACHLMKNSHFYNKENHISEAILSIIKDNQYSLEERYYFFSTEDKFFWFDEKVKFVVHVYWYYNFFEPITYRILSAQYILQNQIVNNNLGYFTTDGRYTGRLPPDEVATSQTFGSLEQVTNDAQSFLLRLAGNKENPVNYRAEASDILIRLGTTKEARLIGKTTIEELGDLYLENKISTIYTNAENVHSKDIEESTANIIKELIKKSKIIHELINKPLTVNIDDIGEILDPEAIHIENIYQKIKDIINLWPEDKQSRVINSFSRIRIDTGKFVGLSLTNILLLIYEKIKEQSQEIQSEMMRRLTQELGEMDETCSSGHFTRIVNVLSGFDNQPSITISIENQLRSNIFGRLGRNLKTLPKHNQSIITIEMTTKDKPLLTEFIQTYNPREELLKEFVPEFIDLEGFNKVYEKAIRDYMGIEEEKV